MYLWDSSSATFESSTFTGNSAEFVRTHSLARISVVEFPTNDQETKRRSDSK